jgi:hypothetical protein
MDFTQLLVQHGDQQKWINEVCCTHLKKVYIFWIIRLHVCYADTTDI